MLQQVSELQTLIAGNEKAHLELNHRIEAMFKARDERMEAIAATANAKADAAASATNAKFDQIMATMLAAQSAQVLPPADEFVDTEDADDDQARGRQQKASGAHSVDARTRSNSREDNTEGSGEGTKKKC